ncbi:MAG: M28 family peptidase [Prevotellaceae bacterium]|nr:M28 family peptidase [Prevotellaceae bacterium]
MKRISLFASFLTISVFFSHTLLGQWERVDENLIHITQQKLFTHVSLLANTITQGRATGSQGALIAANYIMKQFQNYGLHPYSGNSYYQSFRTEGLVGRNVVAMVKGRVYPDEYLIISAHYDHLGEINGTVYPGADNNASGVSLLLQIAEIFGLRAKAGDAPPRSVIFVAYDAKEHNLAGSEYFARTLTIYPYQVIANLNIDQIGTVLEPPNRKSEYLLVLGAEHPSRDMKLIIDVANHYGKIGLDIDYTFYGSKTFFDLFFQIGDQIHLSKRRIPSILFTSGIHAYTNKPTDLPALLNLAVLEKRTQLIYLVANDLATRRSWLRNY